MSSQAKGSTCTYSISTIGMHHTPRNKGSWMSSARWHLIQSVFTSFAQARLAWYHETRAATPSRNVVSGRQPRSRCADVRNYKGPVAPLRTRHLSPSSVP